MKNKEFKQFITAVIAVINKSTELRPRGQVKLLQRVANDLYDLEKKMSSKKEDRKLFSKELEVVRGLSKNVERMKAHAYILSVRSLHKTSSTDYIFVARQESTVEKAATVIKKTAIVNKQSRRSRFCYSTSISKAKYLLRLANNKLRKTMEGIHIPFMKKFFLKEFDLPMYLGKLENVLIEYVNNTLYIKSPWLTYEIEGNNIHTISYEY